MAISDQFDTFAEDLLEERTPRSLIIIGASKVDDLLFQILTKYSIEAIQNNMSVPLLPRRCSPQYPCKARRNLRDLVLISQKSAECTVGYRYSIDNNPVTFFKQQES